MNARRCTMAAGAALALGLALGFAGCDSVLVQPASGGRAVTVSLDLAPAAGGDAAAFDRADGVRLRVQRRKSGALVLDRLLGLTSVNGGKEVSVEIEPTEDPETFDLAVQLVAGSQSLFTGTATVTVQQGRASNAEVSLQAVVASLSLSQTSVTFSAINQVVAVQAYTLFSSGDTSRSATVQWTSGNPAIVTVTPAGSLTSQGEGQTQVTATAGTLSATLQVRVQAVVASVTVAPSADTLAVGEVLSLTATARDANGTALTRTATWASSDAAVASVDATGRVQALAPGMTTVTGAVEGKTGSSVIRVVPPPVASVTVLPPAATVQVGGSIQLQAELRTAAGQLVNRATQWSSGNPAIATVGAGGLVVGVAPGTATITATAENVSGTAQITVSAVPLIALSPASLTFTGVQGGSDPASQTLSITNAGGGTLSWTASDDATWLTLSPSSGTNAGSVTVGVSARGVAAGTYSATISVAGNASNSPRTVPVTLNLTMPPPAAPTSLTAGGVSISQINLAWTDLANNESGFSIERCQGAGCTNFAQIATVGANVTTYQNTGLATATTYVYRVRAYNATGYSGYSGSATAATTSGVAPVLSGGGYTVNIIGDSRCSLYGPTRLGTSFRVTFSFGDSDGDAWLSSSAVGGTWVFAPSGSTGGVGVTYASGPTFTGTGSSGTVTTYQCYVFGSDTYVDVTMTFRDLAGNTAQLSPIRIAKPAGAN